MLSEMQDTHPLLLSLWQRHQEELHRHRSRERDALRFPSERSVLHQQVNPQGFEIEDDEFFSPLEALPPIVLNKIKQFTKQNNTEIFIFKNVKTTSINEV